MESSNVNSNYAGFWVRFLAVFIDGLILILPCWVGAMVIPIFGGLVVGCLYKPVFESSVMQATPGKALMGLQVEMLDGSALKLPQAFGRYFLSFVSGLFLCLGYLIQPFTAKKQTFHDLVIQTVVVQRQQPAGVSYLDVWVESIRGIFGQASSTVTGNPVADAGNNSSAAGSASAGNSSGSTNVSANSSGMSDQVQKLEKLHQLFKEGILTEQEYQAKKEEVLKLI